MSNFERLQGIPPEPVCVHPKTVMGCPGCTARNKRFAVKAIAERDQLRQQVEKLLGAVATHQDQASIYCNKCGYFGPDESGGAHPGCDYLAGLDHRDHCLYQAADQVRKELEGG